MFCTDASSHVADLTVFHNFLESIALSSRVFRIRFFLLFFGFLRFQSIFVFIYFESESERETETQRQRGRDRQTDRQTDRQRSGGRGLQLR